MVVKVATGGIGTRAVDKDYPVDEGLEAGTNKRSSDSASLEAEEKNLTPFDMR